MIIRYLCVVSLLSAGLGSSEIQQVMQQNAPNLRRTCWGTDAGATASVQIRARITIAPSGKVQSVTATGNDATVGKCIETVVAKWTFPAANDPTTVEIPFNFMR